MIWKAHIASVVSEVPTNRADETLCQDTPERNAAFSHPTSSLARAISDPRWLLVCCSSLSMKLGNSSRSEKDRKKRCSLSLYAIHLSIVRECPLMLV